MILCIWDYNFISDMTLIKGGRWIWIRGLIKEIHVEGVIGVVYRHHESNDKSRLWGELLNMKSSLEVSIMLMGDFNEIKTPHE